MENVIRRPWYKSLYYLFFVVNGVLAIFSDEHWAWKLIKISLAILLLIPLIRSFLQRNYFILRDGILIWNRIFASQMLIPLGEIKMIRLDQRPFHSSKIVMHDGRQYSFEDNWTSFDRLRQFFRQDNIPVEG